MFSFLTFKGKQDFTQNTSEEEEDLNKINPQTHRLSLRRDLKVPTSPQ